MFINLLMSAKNTSFGYLKLIFCIVVGHVFNTTQQIFLRSNQRVKLFCVMLKIYHFERIFLHFSVPFFLYFLSFLFYYSFTFCMILECLSSCSNENWHDVKLLPRLGTPSTPRTRSSPIISGTSAYAQYPRYPRYFYYAHYLRYPRETQYFRYPREPPDAHKLEILTPSLTRKSNSGKDCYQITNRGAISGFCDIFKDTSAVVFNYFFLQHCKFSHYFLTET